MDVTGLADPYVKIYLLYNSQRIAKRKTHVKKRTLDPIFNESFVFEIPNGTEGLSKISLEFALLDWDRVTKNEVIRNICIGIFIIKNCYHLNFEGLFNFKFETLKKISGNWTTGGRWS